MVVKRARELNARLGINSIAPVFHQPGNQATAEAIRQYPDTLVGFGYVALGRGDGPWTVEALHQQGFRALKLIIPTKDYDDREFYPIYAKAEELCMPILFHTGVLAREFFWQEMYGWDTLPDIPFRDLDISSARMRPICLDAIARAFPDLNLIMAHFCSLGRRGEAAAVLEHNPNVYADLTTLHRAETEAKVKANAKLLQSLILNPKTYERMLFGTDLTTAVGMDQLGIGIRSINALIDELGLGEELRRKIMGETAERLLGLA